MHDVFCKSRTISTMVVEMPFPDIVNSIYYLYPDNQVFWSYSYPFLILGTRFLPPGDLVADRYHPHILFGTLHTALRIIIIASRQGKHPADAEGGTNIYSCGGVTMWRGYGFGNPMREMRWRRHLWRRGWGGPWGRGYYRRPGCSCCFLFALPFLLLPFAGAALLLMHVI